MRTISIDGRAYPARYSLWAAINIADRYGTVSKALFDEEIGRGERIRRCLDVMTELLLAGAQWSAAEEGKSVADLPDLEQLQDLITGRELEELTLQMMEAITEEDRTDFEARTDTDEGNAEATQVL
jgi:hypothetical protein